MIQDADINEFGEQLTLLGITEKKLQKEVLEYFYQLGKIIYINNVGRYEEES